LDHSGNRIPQFTIKKAKELVKDLHKPVQWIYWADFLMSAIVGHLLFALNANSEKWLSASPATVAAIKGALYVGTVLLFLRAVMFTHELVHLPKEGWNGFRFAWNVLCGIPFLIPSFTYYPHIDHHRRKSYGTDDDGEYLNLSHQSPRAIVFYMMLTLITPVASFIRFGVLSPIAWLYPGIRKWKFQHASTMAMDFSYVRPEASDRVYRVMYLQEAACFLVCVGIVLHAPLVAKTWFDPLWFHAYAVSLAILLLNNIRTLGAHRWTGEGSELTFEQQLLDSCDYPYNPWITELWGPTGTRYHATHHLFPSLPYHNLGKAHRRLMAGLPEDSIFRETVKRSLWQEIGLLWQRSAEAERSRASVLRTQKAERPFSNAA
jgi:fatty acid desaturase